MKGIVYLDHAATTGVSDGVREAMLPFFSSSYGNPSGIYEFAAESRKAVAKARKEIAEALGCKEHEIFFTSGGTEADNWALRGVAESLGKQGGHIITSRVEHHAVLHTCEWLEKHGVEISYVDVDENGLIKTEELKRAIRPDTILISVMTANNEIGTIQPVREIADIAKSHGILFHTDAVQAFGHIPLSVEELGVDLLSVSGHKLQGPKGIGFLYVREGVPLPAMLYGGKQERGKRAGTENVPGIVGLAQAVREACEAMEENQKKQIALRDYFMDEVLLRIPYSRVNGSRIKRLPNNVNFSFQFLEGESLLIMLDAKGICASSGSACTTGDAEPSHVLMAIGLPEELARGSVRFTLGPETTREEIDYVIEALSEAVGRLRKVSPFYEELMHNRSREYEMN